MFRAHPGRQKRSVDADLAEAERKRKDAVKLAPKKLMVARELEIRQARVDGFKASAGTSSNGSRNSLLPGSDPIGNLPQGNASSRRRGYLVLSSAMLMVS